MTATSFANVIDRAEEYDDTLIDNLYSKGLLSDDNIFFGFESEVIHFISIQAAYEFDIPLERMEDIINAYCFSFIFGREYGDKYLFKIGNTEFKPRGAMNLYYALVALAKEIKKDEEEIKYVEM